MSTAKQQPLPASNAETLEARDGPLSERFVKYRHIVVAGLQCHGEEAMRLHPPKIGDRTLDTSTSPSHRSAPCSSHTQSPRCATSTSP